MASEEKLLVAARCESKNNQENTVEYKRRKREKSARNLREKELHGKFVRQIEDVACDISWQL